MLENWYVLCVAILRNDVSIEQAFQIYKDGKRLRTVISKEDVEDMIELKKTCTNVEIGYMYGITDGAVCKRIKEYKKMSSLQRAQN